MTGATSTSSDKVSVAGGGRIATAAPLPLDHPGAQRAAERSGATRTQAPLEGDPLRRCTRRIRYKGPGILWCLGWDNKLYYRILEFTPRTPNFEIRGNPKTSLESLLKVTVSISYLSFVIRVPSS